MPLRAVSQPLRSPSHSLSLRAGGPARPFSLSTARNGDTLNEGRYRLVDRLVLPDNQQEQGAAWLAVDTATNQAQVVLREVVVPANEVEPKKNVVRQVALRLSEATQHPGFAKITDVFDEADSYFIVFQHLEGESLASLLRRQGGALPERTVAEYGRQLCEMLTVLRNQQPPLVHGSINPETVVVSPDRMRVHLIHLPLFPPKEPANANATVGYKAPEQARGIPDPASDLYSVAATMHHAVTGFDPRERIAFFYPPARRLNPLVAQPLETVLAQELRLSEAQRYASPSNMQADLASFLATRPPEPERKPIVAFGVDPLKQDMAVIRRRIQQRNRTQLYVISGICLAVLLFAGFMSLLSSLKSSPPHVAQPTPNPTATMISQISALNNEWQAEASLYQSRQIGLSDGRYAFDLFAGRSAADISAKKQAAQALQHSDLTTALSDYSQAIVADRTDAEARIYEADLQIQKQNEPYVTIILGLPLDGSAAHLSIARPDLQAAFVLQNQVNTQNPSPLPGGAKLRILIGNSGVQDSDVATIAQFIAKRVQIGNLEHIVAVVGWPTSGESSDAASILADAHIPMVTQTATSTMLGGISPYFFRVNPDDTAQGQAQGQLAYQTLGARLVLVLRDPSDADSQSQADAFASSFKQLGGKVIENPADNFVMGQTTVEQFREQAVNDAMTNHVDLIYLPGQDVDGVRLARAVGLEEQMYGWSVYLSRLKILGGDGFDTSLILGNGSSTDALLAKSDPLDMQRLVFTAFADPLEWTAAKPPAFLTAWDNLYGIASVSDPNPPTPVDTAIMVGDAFGVLVYAMEHVDGALSSQSLRDTLASIGAGNLLQPYQGLSGLISFDSNGNAVNKTIVLLGVVAGTASQNELKLIATSAKSGS